MAKRNNIPVEKESDTNVQNNNSSSMPSYLEAALRIPSSYPLGAGRVDNGIYTSPSVTVSDNTPVAGAMVLDYLPTLGVSTTPTSALNRAAFNEFNAIRSQISGNRSYEPADHMIYRVAVDSMRELYDYVKRIYGIVRAYSATNLYRPRDILTAMGLNADSWISNAAELYQWLHNHQTCLQPFPTVPIGNITERRRIFNTYLFTDGDIDSTQTYIINQKAFWSYEKVDEVKGLTPRYMPATYQDFIDMWDEMYAALQGSFDVYIIAADIRRAFGDNVLTTMSAPDVDYSVEYVKLDPVLCSIMNATVCNFNNLSDDFISEVATEFRIEDVDGILQCSPTITYTYDSNMLSNFTYYCGCGHFNHINSIESAPSATTLLNSVRFKPLIDSRTVESDAMIVYFKSMGTEVIVGARILTNLMGASDDTNQISEISSIMAPAVNVADSVNPTIGAIALNNLFRALSALSVFDWHPPVALLACTNIANDIIEPLGPNSAAAHVVEDIQNYIPISDKNLEVIHDANLLAEFGIK